MLLVRGVASRVGVSFGGGVGSGVGFAGGVASRIGAGFTGGVASGVSDIGVVIAREIFWNTFVGTSTVSCSSITAGISSSNAISLKASRNKLVPVRGVAPSIASCLASADSKWAAGFTCEDGSSGDMKLGDIIPLLKLSRTCFFSLRSSSSSTNTCLGDVSMD